MLHSRAQTVAAVVLLIGDLSVRRGQWRSDAAGSAQCGSGEAAPCLLRYSPSFIPIPNPLSFLLRPCSLSSFSILVSIILHCLSSSPPHHSSLSVSLHLCCSPSLLHLVYLPGCLDKLHRGVCCFWMTLSMPALYVNVSKQNTTNIVFCVFIYSYYLYLHPRSSAFM